MRSSPQVVVSGSGKTGKMSPARRNAEEVWAKLTKQGGGQDGEKPAAQAVAGRAGRLSLAR